MAQQSAVTLNVNDGGIGISTLKVFMPGSEEPKTRKEEQQSEERPEEPKTRKEEQQSEERPLKPKSKWHTCLPIDQIVDNVLRSQIKGLMKIRNTLGPLMSKEILEIEMGVKELTGARADESEIRSKFRSVKDTMKRMERLAERVNAEGETTESSETIKNQEDSGFRIPAEVNEEENSELETEGNEKNQCGDVTGGFGGQSSFCMDMNLAGFHLRAAYEQLRYIGWRMGWDGDETKTKGDETTIPSSMEEV